MPKITVRKSPYTKKLFECDIEYAKHLQVIRTELRVSREEKRVRREFDAWFKSEIETLYTPDEIAEWVAKNFRRIFIGTDGRCFPPVKPKALPPEDLKMEITFSDLTWSENSRNTHRAPRGERRNWGGNETYADGTPIPTGYPGWSGHVNIHFPEGKESGWYITDILTAVGINTGSGGGGSTSLRYGCQLFLSDWPGLKKTLVHRKLSGDSKDF